MVNKKIYDYDKSDFIRMSETFTTHFLKVVHLITVGLNKPFSQFYWLFFRLDYLKCQYGRSL